jgi:hypothetical protein
LNHVSLPVTVPFVSTGPGPVGHHPSQQSAVAQTKTVSHPATSTLVTATSVTSHAAVAGHPAASTHVVTTITASQSAGRPVSLNDFFIPPPKGVRTPGLTADQLMARWQADLYRREEQIFKIASQIAGAFTLVGEVPLAAEVSWAAITKFYSELLTFERLKQSYDFASELNDYKGVVQDPFANDPGFVERFITQFMAAHPKYFAAHPYVTAGITQFLHPLQPTPTPTPTPTAFDPDNDSDDDSGQTGY